MRTARQDSGAEVERASKRQKFAPGGRGTQGGFLTEANLGGCLSALNLLKGARRRVCGCPWGEPFRTAVWFDSEILRRAQQCSHLGQAPAMLALRLPDEPPVLPDTSGVAR